MQRGSITLDQKLKYEVHQIYALSKKTLPPKGKSWNDIADARLRKVLQMPVREDTAAPVNIQSGGMHHEHSPRSARIIERTLKTGMLPPDIVHSYHTGRDIQRPKFSFRDIYMPGPEPDPEDHRAVNVVQHIGADSDLVYPHGHLQGDGFIPKDHAVNSHVPLTSSAPAGMQVPTKDGAAAGAHFH